MRASRGALTVADLTAIVVNFRTLDETRTCLTTLRKAYPRLRVIAIDNGSMDESTDFLRQLEARDDFLHVIVNETNVFHGPALDQGMRAAETDLVFLLDSDCEIRHGGFLEPLVQAFESDPLLYAIGKRGYTNRRGYGPISSREKWTYYVHPFAAVLDRRKYLTLPPFVHHGAPLYRNMWGAAKAGYHLRHVTIEDHVVHRRRATASVHGYGYGRRLRLQARMNSLDHRVRGATARLLRRELRAPELPPARTGEPPELRDYERERLRSGAASAAGEPRQRRRRASGGRRRVDDAADPAE
jgi:glycosyltransferase involved in cell wall biosynthesis